jgi:hypothetical protein
MSNLDVTDRTLNTVRHRRPSIGESLVRRVQDITAPVIPSEDFCAAGPAFHAAGKLTRDIAPVPHRKQSKTGHRLPARNLTGTAKPLKPQLTTVAKHQQNHE